MFSWWAVHAQSNPISISQLTEKAFVYTTFNEFNGTLFPSNSMYVVTSAGIVLLDTPWDTTQFQPLLDSLENRHHLPVLLCISTHFHADRTAGLEYFAAKGIATWSSALTYKLCVANNEKKAEHVFVNDTTFSIGEFTFETFYPGEGHAPDNIVIWIPELQLLYGGCFVKSTAVNDLGNLSHANPAQWAISVQKVMTEYPDPAFVIPGHYGWSKKDALKHTLKLIKKQQNLSLHGL